MGWGNCGTDSEGRPIGYMHVGTCDHKGCDAIIDSGLSYACGGMHGQHAHDCEKYFCTKHLRITEDPDEEGAVIQLCEGCFDELEKTNDAEVPKRGK